MRQPRPPESFPRVYSPPEPPSAARRFAFVGVLTVVLTLGLAGLAVFYLVGFGGKSSHGRPLEVTGQRPSTGQPTAISPTPQETLATPTESAFPSNSPSNSPLNGQPFVRLPPACGTPAEATSLRLVPSPRITTKSSNSTVAICTVVSKRGTHPALHVEAYLFPPSDGGDPSEDAKRFLATEWTQAQQDDGQARNVVLQRHPGLGDEAFHSYKIVKGQPVVVGEIEVRVRNAVVRVAYSQDAPAKANEQATQKRLLDEAAEVAQQALRAFV